MTDLTKGNKVSNLTRAISSVAVEKQKPFGEKVLPDGKKIFRRVHGHSGSVQDTPTNIDFVVPYAKCKILGVEILNAKLGDKANFQVLDTADGLVQQSMGVPAGSITPFLQLNQYGFDVFIRPDSALYPSKYDADLIGGMVLRMAYDPVDVEARTIYINFDLHEVV